MNKYPRRAQNLNISIKYKIKHVFQITTKTNNEPNFQYTKLSVIELVLTDKRNLSGATGQDRPVANLSVVDFRSQPREMSLPKSLNTQFPIFLFLPLLGKFERPCL